MAPMSGHLNIYMSQSHGYMLDNRIDSFGSSTYTHTIAKRRG